MKVTYLDLMGDYHLKCEKQGLKAYIQLYSCYKWFHAFQLFNSIGNLHIHFLAKR